MFVPVYFVIFAVSETVGLYAIIGSKVNATFKYMDGVGGESNLRECEIHEVCNVVHNRFWMSSLTERLCRCPNGKECPWKWTAQLENSSVSLNNRSHLKFCAPMAGVNVCTRKAEAARVHGKSDRNNSYLIPHGVTVNCVCPETHYWRLQKYTYETNHRVIQTFKCAKKIMCEAHDFCGHIRSDLYSTYYRCTCPSNHLCIFKDRVEENVQELLYSGPAYRAYCLPFKNNSII